MLRLIVPIILIVVAIAGFVMFASPLYQDVANLQAQVASYDEALGNAKSLESQRDNLTTKENGISLENKVKLEKFLPNNVDNIRLILEIGNIAKPYGMILGDVKYGASNTSTAGSQPGTTAQNISSNSLNGLSNSNYGSLDLEFSTTGTYDNFLSFLNDLEHNLRIVDVSSIQFSSDSGAGATPSQGVDLNSYKYSFKIRTYWLKN